MYQLVILEDGERELREAAEWYEQRSTGLGLRFIEVISRKLQVIHEILNEARKKLAISVSLLSTFSLL